MLAHNILFSAGNNIQITMCNNVRWCCLQKLHLDAGNTLNKHYRQTFYQNIARLMWTDSAATLVENISFIVLTDIQTTMWGNVSIMYSDDVATQQSSNICRVFCADCCETTKIRLFFRHSRNIENNVDLLFQLMLVLTLMGCELNVIYLCLLANVMI